MHHLYHYLYYYLYYCLYYNHYLRPRGAAIIGGCRPSGRLLRFPLRSPMAQIPHQPHKSALS
jgi:hypothetical protein